LAAEAAEEFMKLKIGTSPLIEVSPKSTVFEVSDQWYLKKICTIFGDYQPMGCVKPFACNTTEYQSFTKKNAVAHFDRDCGYFDNVPTVTTTSITLPV
jgi:hypothetical protein